MIEIIPAIDIIDGRCVRLSQGDYQRKKVYDANPVDMAKSYRDAGLRRIHLVDLDGAKASAPENLRTLEAVASATGLDIEWGGGIKSYAALESVFNAGAQRAICGSIAVTAPEMFESWLTAFGAQRMILGADLDNGFVATHGWIEKSSVTVDDLIDRFAAAGLNQVICTDISKDGMLQGPSFDLYTRLQGKYEGVDITVSGGISCMNDIERLNDAGLRCVIVGKALYEDRITLKEIERWLQNA